MSTTRERLPQPLSLEDRRRLLRHRRHHVARTLLLALSWVAFFLLIAWLLAIGALGLRG